MSNNHLNEEAALEAILKHWQQKDPHDRFAHLIKDAWRGLTRAFQTRLSEHSVSFGHWVYLRILWEKDGITQSELSEQAGLMLSTTFAATKAMERLGYIHRERKLANRRNVYVFLTQQGRELQRILIPFAEEVNAIALRGVDSRDVVTTRRTLVAIIQNLVQDELELIKAERRVPSTRELARMNGASSPGQTKRSRRAKTSKATSSKE